MGLLLGIPSSVAAAELDRQVQLVLELKEAEELRFEWVGASPELIWVSEETGAVVFQGLPPKKLILHPGRYWIWSAGTGVMKITSRRV